MITEIWHNILQHPLLALVCTLFIGVWGLIETYAALLRARNARDHWSGEFGFRPTGGRSDTRGLR